jgi:hypothetical protein
MAAGRACSVSGSWLGLVRWAIVDGEASLVSVNEGIAVDLTVLHVLLRKGATLGD